MATTKRTTSTAVAVIPSKDELQNSLNEAIKTIDKRLKQLGVYGNYLYKAQGNFKMNENDSNTINIQSSVDVNYLVQALGKMKRLKKEMEETYDTLGITEYQAPRHMGNPIDAWISDLTHRIKVVVNTVIITQLNERRVELTTHLSAEQRLFETLQKTATLLK